MKNFISTVYIKTNSVSDERICIGLFAGTTEQSFFAWSETKLKLIIKLVSSDVYISLSKSISNLKEDIIYKTESKHQGEFFYTNEYSSDYFRYLSRYSKGLLEFNEPKPISNVINEKDFGNLFELYVGEKLHKPISTSRKDSLYKHVKTILQHPIFVEKTDRNYEVPVTVAKTIYRPVEVDFISCNGSILTGHAIDFTNQPNTIEKKLYEFRVLTEGLKMFAEERKLDNAGKYIVYFNNPEGKEQKDLFNNVYEDKTKPFELIEVDAMEDITKKLKNNYRKFSEII
jgi:hypothetical protein